MLGSTSVTLLLLLVVGMQPQILCGCVTVVLGGTLLLFCCYNNLVLLSGNRTKKEHSQSLSSFWTLVNQWSPFCASGVGIMSALCPPWTETENAETSSYSERNNQIKSPEGAIVVGQGSLWVFWSLGIQHRSSKWPLWCLWKKSWPKWWFIGEHPIHFYLCSPMTG